MIYFETLTRKLNFKSPSFVVIFDLLGLLQIDEKILSEYNFFINEYPEKAKADFVLAFATEKSQLDAFALDFSQKTEGDPILWVAYPKSSSKRFRSDFNRDAGWEVFGAQGFEPVRQIALDGEWSALRFRRVDYIRKMTRSFALSDAGREKATATNTSLKTLEAPEDFLRELSLHPTAANCFNTLSPSHRKEYIRWITDAKKEETRTRRIMRAVEMLEQGRKYL